MFPVAYEVDRSMYRLTVDTAEDLKLISILIEKYHADQLSYKDIISILDEEQSLSKINTHIPQKKWNE
jgi:spore coat polysaccharide biosynthesis protein SpsF (cytidylyltransferase family)